MKNFVFSFGLTLLALSFLSCSKPADYLYVHPLPAVYTTTFKVREVVSANRGALDIFWAIGGMTEQQSNFQSGINSFMSTFTQKNLSYRMAVCSSNVTEKPTLGMPTIFDDSTPGATNVFVNGVMRALNGMDDEVIFDPVVVNLQKYPGFLRPDATLVVILTNDAPDGSKNIKLADNFLNFLKALKGGDLKKVIVYGIFGATDLNCARAQIDSDWIYHGSEFEKAIVKTGGLAYSLCDATFGASLAKIGDDIYKRLEHPKVVLSRQADPATIHVFFHDAELPGGPQESGGMWYYDIDANAVVFYTLDFAKNDTEEVVVKYEDDNGTK